MSAHSYIYVTIFYFLNYLFFKKKFFFSFLKMILTYHISHEKIFSTALYVHGRSGVKHLKKFFFFFLLPGTTGSRRRVRLGDPGTPGSRTTRVNSMCIFIKI